MNPVGVLRARISACLSPNGHGVRLRVQVRAVHRIHDVVDGVAVVHVPETGAEHLAPVGRSELLGQFELARLGVQGIAEVEKDRAVALLDGVGAHLALLLHRAVVHRRDVDHRAAAVDLDAVVPARHAVAEVPAHGEARAAVRAAVLEGAHGAVLVAPHDDVLAETCDADRSVVHAPARQHRVPDIAQSGVEDALVVRLCGIGGGLGHGDLPRWRDGRRAGCSAARGVRKRRPRRTRRCR